MYYVCILQRHTPHYRAAQTWEGALLRLSIYTPITKVFAVVNLQLEAPSNFFSTRNNRIRTKMTAPTAARHIVNFITGNANKLGEVKAILEPAIQVESQALDLIEIQGTLEEVTLDKCRRAADLV